MNYAQYFAMNDLPEIIFSSSDPVDSRRIGQWIDEGRLRKIIPRAYTSNLKDDLEVIVRRNIWMLISRLFPGSLVSHRTAIEHTMSLKGNIYLTSSSRRVYKWPGITVRFAAGPAPLDTDTPYYETLFVSTFERACLENLSPSRESDGEKRTVNQDIIENRLLDILNTRGEEAVNEVRDNARIIAQKLEMPKAFERLDQIIGALLATRPIVVLASKNAKAHYIGMPYDSGRIELFHTLELALRKKTFAAYPAKSLNALSFRNLAFFEAYFSNYIEGTTFLVEEAMKIVYEDAIIHLRIADTHDIKGTYAICSDKNEMQRIPDSLEKMIELLRTRHRVMMAGRQEKNPGAFKSVMNRAGETVFVEPAFIEGTLAEGFKIYHSLLDPVARALFMMFMISEVHPFEDGNGRIARLMMNAELVHADYSEIIIPTVYREDYLLTLRRLSRKSDPEAYINMMLRALEFSHKLDPEDLEQLQLQLEASNAFSEPEERRLK